MVFRERLKQRRELLGLTQEELGARLSKDQKAVWRWETGRATPNVDTLLELARVLDTTADYLVGLTDTYQRPITSAVDLSAKEKELIQILRNTNADLDKLVEFMKAVS